MKTLAILLCIAGVAVAQSPATIYSRYVDFSKNVVKDCANKLNLAQDVLDRFNGGIHTTDVKTVGCLRACVFEEQRVLANGKLSMEAMTGAINAMSGMQPDLAAKLWQVAKECGGQVKDVQDKCQQLTDFANCAGEKLEAMFPH